MMELAREPKLSFIVPVYNLNRDVYKRCLMSLEDQDYGNIEVICVFDGVQPLLVNVAVEFAKRNKNFRIVEIEHAGACAARNAGFKASSGEIVSFFNSDYVAKPGMARMWVDALLANPDCGFVYGGYEYASRNRAWYSSRSFDPWLLTQANYIDCGFPLWRKHVVEWDVNCKSLQDWDFWLRVVSHGVKGHYLGREISYVAEVPREGGLSMDSAAHWIERVRYVKKQNGIPESEFVVTSLGAPYHGVQIARMIGADYRDDTIMKPNEYKALYMIGFYMTPRDTSNPHADILHRYEAVPKIVHFVGADIYWLRKFSYEQLKGITGALKLKVEHILCENERARRELADLGLEAEIVPIPPYYNYAVLPLPERFKVAIFLTNHSDFDKYCQEETLSVVRAMPDVQFTAYGDALQDIQYPNLTHVGNIYGDDWKQFVYDHSCYFRLVRHDTRPMASDEFILAGRDVVTNVLAPYVHCINTAGDIAVNDWDHFGPGLNAYHWPETKKKIVQTIRRVRCCPSQAVFPGESASLLRRRSLAQEAADAYGEILDRQKYIDKIRSLAGINEKELCHV